MRRPSRRRVALAALLVGSIMFLAYSLRGPQWKGPSTAGPPALRSDAGAEAEAGERKLRAAAPEDVDFRRYAALGSSELFSEQRGAPAPARPAALPPPPPLPRAEPAAPVERGPDLSGWSYVGYVTLDGELLGILQNESTQASKYLAVGDTFLGARVESVDREAIRFRSGASRQTLNRPRDFPLSPLSKAAPAPSPAPGQRPPAPPQLQAQEQ